MKLIITLNSDAPVVDLANLLCELTEADVVTSIRIIPIAEAFVGTVTEALAEHERIKENMRRTLDGVEPSDLDEAMAAARQYTDFHAEERSIVDAGRPVDTEALQFDWSQLGDPESFPVRPADHDRGRRHMSELAGDRQFRRWAHLLEYPCTTCGARVYEVCKMASGYTANEPHAARYRAHRAAEGVKAAPPTPTKPTKVLAVQDFDCTKCGAQPGESCRPVGSKGKGNYGWSFFHTSRYLARIDHRAGNVGLATTKGGES